MDGNVAEGSANQSRGVAGVDFVPHCGEKGRSVPKSAIMQRARRRSVAAAGFVANEIAVFDIAPETVEPWKVGSHHAKSARMH